MDSKIYTITEFSRMLNISESTIRKYEKDFDLKIPRNEIGNRYYTEKDLELFNQIIELKNNNFNIHQIRELLNKSTVAQEQNSQALDLMKVDQLTVHELKETMANYIAEIIMEKEEELAKEYETKLEVAKNEILQSLQESISSENQKLIELIDKNREEDKSKNIFSKIFKK